MRYVKKVFSITIIFSLSLQSIPFVDSIEGFVFGIISAHASITSVDSRQYAVRTTQNAQLLFYHPDHLGSSSVLTDNNGDVVQRMQYYPYGDMLYEYNAPSSMLLAYKFTGQELDSETALYYYGARYYDLSLGVFISPDPISISRLSSYQYVASNPLKFVDPTGELLKFSGSDEEFNELFLGLFSTDEQKIFSLDDEGFVRINQDALKEIGKENLEDTFLGSVIDMVQDPDITTRLLFGNLNTTLDIIMRRNEKAVELPVLALWFLERRIFSGITLVSSDILEDTYLNIPGKKQILAFVDIEIKDKYNNSGDNSYLNLTSDEFGRFLKLNTVAHELTHASLIGKGEPYGDGTYEFEKILMRNLQEVFNNFSKGTELKTNPKNFIRFHLYLRSRVITEN